MDIESLAKELILKNMTPEQQDAVLESVKASVAQAKEVQKQRIGENVGIVVQALKKIEADIQSRYDLVGNTLEKRVASIKDGKDGKDGRDGKNGKDGRDGKQGVQGVKGENGRDGRDGVDGNDGIGVSFARIDFDGSLVIGLSSGIELNVGEVVAPDLAESIKVITNGGGTSQSVLDTLASLQTQITNLIPSQTGNSGKFLTTNGTALSWSSVAGGLSYQGTWNASTNTPTLTSSVGVNGYYYIVATAGSTNLDGITDWQIGDWLMFNGSVWQKIDQSNLVTSVAGRTGAVTLSNTDISGLGTMSTQNASSVAITGGSITGITDLAVADGGTGSSTAQGAINTLAGAVTSGSYLRGNGTNVVMNTIQAADVPTLNQNTTGSAATLTTGRTIAITGDLAYTSPSFNGSSNVTAAGTLATVNTNVGSFTNASITVNGKGLVTAASSGTAPVTSVTGTSPVVSSGGATPAISLATAYGDTLNPYASKTANFVLAAPNGSAGVPTFRAVVAADIPTLNQNTTGTASNVTGTVAIANGGTGQTTATLGFNALAPSQTSNSGKYLTTNGTNTSWATITAGASISNDTTTSTNLYPLFAAATSGTPTTIYTGNTKYLYKPSTGELSAPAPIATNGIMLHSTTVGTSYTIASGNNGFSVGPITVASGQAVTISSGQRWLVL